MWPFGSTPKKRVTRSKGELAQIAAEHRTAERGYFSSGGGGKRRPAASGGSAKRSTGTTYQGYAIKRTEEGEYVIPRLDADSRFDSLADAKAFLRSWKQNPSLPARWDIENSQGGNWQTVGSVRADSAKEALSRYRGEHPEWSKGRKLRARAQRGNPADAAAAKYEEFHGRPSEETVTVKREIHYHKHLASLGKLKKLVVVSREGYNVPIDRFKGAILCENEKGTQLYVEGGDQAVDLSQFGIDPDEAHEMEVLGDVIQVLYFTRKDHLGKEGGIANYDHKFEEPYPELQYDVRNEQLIFSGGRYVILPEGIDR
jgi:sulfur carrier protein ThiS